MLKIVVLILVQILNNILIINSYTIYPQYSLAQLHSDPNYVRVMTVYKRTQTKIPQDQLRTIATIGLINGAIETEKNLEKYLTEKVSELILNVNLHEDDKKLRIEELEKIIERDRNAIKILGTILDYATHSITNSQYKNQLKKIMREYARGQKEIKRKLSIEENSNEKMSTLKTKILDHVDTMKKTIQDKANKTMSYVETLSHLKDYKIHRSDFIGNLTNSDKSDDVLQSVIKDNDNENLIDPLKKSDSTEFSFDEYQEEFTQNRRKRKQNSLRANLKNNNNSTSATALRENTENSNTTIKVNNPEKLQSEKQEDNVDINVDHQNQEDNIGLSAEVGGGGGGDAGGGKGGLPGLISSLSGGEEGSDIGALLGAITGLVSRLFGPGGLDIPTLLSSGTSLVAGLLGGGKNFGTVLGEYVGLILDGFSGGGGADLNGKFLGNLVGTTLAELSAVVIQKRINHRKVISDPEDEDGPPKPRLFVTTFIRNLMKAKNRMASDSSEEDDSNEKPNANGNGNTNGHSKGSNPVGFLKHIVSAIAGGVTSFILNASLGSSSGSAKGSATLSGSLSNSSSDSGHKSH